MIDGNELSVLFLLKWKKTLWVLANTRNTILSVLFPYVLLPPKLNFFQLLFLFLKNLPFGKKTIHLISTSVFSGINFNHPSERNEKINLTLFIHFIIPLRKLQHHWKTSKLSHGDVRPSLVLAGVLRIKSGMMRGGKIPAILICMSELFFVCFPCLDWCVDFRWPVCFWPRTLFAWCIWKLPFRILTPQLGAIGAVLLCWPKFVSTFKSHLSIFKITSFTCTLRSKSHGSKWAVCRGHSSTISPSITKDHRTVRYQVQPFLPSLPRLWVQALVCWKTQDFRVGPCKWKILSWNLDPWATSSGAWDSGDTSDKEFPWNHLHWLPFYSILTCYCLQTEWLKVVSDPLRTVSDLYQ